MSAQKEEDYAAAASACISHKDYVLAIDPGFTNFAVAGFTIDNKETTYMFGNTYDVQKDPHKIALHMKSVAHVCRQKGIRTALIEFQPPIGGTAGGSARWNAYIEGCAAGVLASCGMHVITIHPATVKSALHLARGSNALNKVAVKEFAHKAVPQIQTSHLADCYAIAEYYRQHLYNRL